MRNTNFDQELKGFDYSVFSRVKDSLLDELLQKHRADNFGKFQKFSAGLFADRLNDDELDMVAAAGNPSVQEKPRDKQSF